MGTPEQFASRLVQGALTEHKRRLMSRVVLIVERNAKKEAPVRTAHLRRSITSTVERTGDRGRVGTNVHYAVMVHEGTKRHIILPKRPGGVLRFKGASGKIQFAKHVRHPGTRPNPFLERGLRRSKAAIQQEMKAMGVAFWKAMKV